MYWRFESPQTGDLAGHHMMSKACLKGPVDQMIGIIHLIIMTEATFLLDYF